MQPLFTFYQTKTFINKNNDKRGCLAANILMQFDFLFIFYLFIQNFYTGY